MTTAAAYYLLHATEWKCEYYTTHVSVQFQVLPDKIIYM
jgi:hypothetical protein